MNRLDELRASRERLVLAADDDRRRIEAGCTTACNDNWSRSRKRGHNLDFGVGIALGHATCGEVGFEGRSGYAAIGAVTNLASRFADEATGGQIQLSEQL